MVLVSVAIADTYRPCSRFVIGDDSGITAIGVSVCIETLECQCGNSVDGAYLRAIQILTKDSLSSTQRH